MSSTARHPHAPKLERLLTIAEDGDELVTDSLIAAFVPTLLRSARPAIR